MRRSMLLLLTYYRIDYDDVTTTLPSGVVIGIYNPVSGVMHL